MNKLANATSPYLRQHAGNPVHWEEWGEDAFRRAREEDKPILLSVGYAACHWCHVMAHESFENEAIAKQMNEGFVSIKVDREERPDVDQVYQHAIQLLGVGGGWPLTAFLMPDGKPFYGGTYYPPDDRYGRPGFPRVLAAIRDAWVNRRHEVVENAAELTDAVKKLDVVPPASAELVGDVLGKCATWLLQRIDADNGGFGDAPKFPASMSIEVLLRWARRGKLDERAGGERGVAGEGGRTAARATEVAQDAAVFSLGKMAEGGIYDHIGGGFHRYSVDARWHVPHFEKMLYDNGLLLRSYAQGWQATGLTWLRSVAEDIATWMLRDMRDPDGAFYASTDADSAPPSDPKAHPEEGEFFVWTKKEIVEVLGEKEAEVTCLRYGVTEAGNWEHGKNVLFLAMGDGEIGERTGRTVDEVRASLRASREKMFAAREVRPRPFRDEKRLTSWNGLAIGGLAFAGGAFGDAEYVGAAARAAKAVLAGAWVPVNGKKRLLRAPQAPGHAPLLATVDDHAYLADALLDLWEATLDDSWIALATGLVDEALGLFVGADGEVFVTGSDADALVHRPVSLQDQSVPSGAAVLVRAALRLSRLTGRDDLEAAARRILDRHRTLLVERPFGFSAMVSAWDLADRPVDVVVAGVADARSAPLVGRVRARFVPNLVLHVAPPDGGKARSPHAEGKPPVDGAPAVYVCRDRTCSAPVTDVSSLDPLLA